MGSPDFFRMLQVHVTCSGLMLQDKADTALITPVQGIRGGVFCKQLASDTSEMKDET
jgi:hypothetical protein